LLSPSSILLLPQSQCAFIPARKKNSASVEKCIFLNFSTWLLFY
jgi:hypothetical protein